MLRSAARRPPGAHARPASAAGLVTPDEKIAAALRAGEPHAAIASRLRVGTRRISTVAKAHGLTRKRGPRGAPLTRQIDELLLQGESPGAIARALGCSRAYVYQRRATAGS